MKYSISEFAKQIRDLYPGDYDDLSDEKLVELWLKKYPKDIDKVELKKENNTDNDSIISKKRITRFIIKTVIVITILYLIYLKTH
jgi:hypothetical protein